MDARSVPGRRPFHETWWFFCVLSAQFWLHLVLWPFQGVRTLVDDLSAGLGLGLLVLGTPLWAWLRRRARHQRSAAGAGQHGATGA